MDLITTCRKYFIINYWRFKKLDIYNIYKELKNRNSWTRERWEDYQNFQIQEFIQYCYNNVSYYKELFDNNGINPYEIKDKESLKRIPILTKDIVRDNIDKLLASNIPKEKMKKTNTSGSTGKPLTLYSDKSRSEYLAAGLWRIYLRCGWKPGERIGYIWGFQTGGKDANGLKKRIKEFFTGATYLSAWKANDEDFQEWYKRLEHQKVKLLVCYASSGSRFASWLLDNGLKLNSIKGVFCTSEKLFDHQKALIEKAFNSKVFNLYGCGEVNHVACTCANGKMHVNPDMVVVEVDEPNDSGNTPLILTGFRNLGMPFLRYQNGDAGSLINEKCSCGFDTEQMELNVSRLSDIFTFQDGKKYPSLYFILRIYKEGFEGIELFQFYQDKIDHIYFYIVKNEKFNAQTEEKLKMAVLEIQNHINDQAIVELIYKDYIEQSKSSKHYYARSDIK